MPDLIRCHECIYYPGHGERCEVRPAVRCTRHARTCQHFELNDYGSVIDELAPIDVQPPTCGDCYHRSPTTVCYTVSNRERCITRVSETALICADFEPRMPTT